MQNLFKLTSNVNVPLWLRSITANKYRLYFAASTRREHDVVEEHLTHTHCLAGKIEDKWHVIVLHSHSRLDIPIECIIDQRNAEEKSQGLLLVWNFDRVIEFLIWRIVYISWFLPEIEDVENFEIVEHPIVYLKKIFDNEMCPNNSKRTPIRTTPTSNSFLSFYEMKTSLSGRKRRYISTHVWYQLMGLIWAKTRCISHQLSHWVEYAENKLSWHLLAKGEHSHVCIIKQCLYRSLIYIWFNRNSIQRLFLIWDGRRICSADFHGSAYNHIELTNDVYIEEKRRESTWWFDSSNSTKNAGA